MPDPLHKTNESDNTESSASNQCEDGVYQARESPIPLLIGNRANDDGHHEETNSY